MMLYEDDVPISNGIEKITGKIWPAGLCINSIHSPHPMSKKIGNW